MVFSQLDRLRSGHFSAIHLVPPATTWSRVRHSSVPFQPPLGTRQELLGASRLAPLQQPKVVQSNSEVEASCWFLEQALRCVARQVQVLLVFNEDRLMGRRRSGIRLRTSLSGLSDARRGSARELSGADQRRPLGIFTNVNLLKAPKWPGWPLMHLQGNTELSYRGPLPPSCQCLPAHPPLVSTSERRSAPPLPKRVASSFGGTRWLAFCRLRDTRSLGMRRPYLRRALSSFSPGSHGFSFASFSGSMSQRHVAWCSGELPSTLWAQLHFWTYLIAVPLCPVRRPPLVFFFESVAGVFQLVWSFVRAHGGSATEGRCFGWLQCVTLGVTSGSVHSRQRSLDGVSFVFVRWCVC